MSGDVNLEELRKRFLAHEQQFNDLLAYGLALLREELARRRLVGVEVHGRVKAVAGFVKKAIRKNYASPWDEIRDKVGFRLTAVYSHSIGDLEDLVEQVFELHNKEDKRAKLAANTLDYLGSHFEVSLRPPCPPLLDNLVFEIQVHTAAESLWAGISHELLYKTPIDPPLDVRRSLYRLLALAELFDLETARCQTAIMRDPDFPEALVLFQLERLFLGLTAHRTDPELSRFVVTTLRPAFEGQDLSGYPHDLEAFVGQHKSKLSSVYGDYLNDDRNPLMSQPESLLIFERLENDPFLLQNVWSQSQNLPIRLLTSFAAIWGKPLGFEEGLE